eukprot:CAMPEP_0184863866 /NCGR_PEP_ID=MMETSP0580-20130426/12904_1 /TAXON_ID=1118495 /ORGANISM="Dactyliosolen fragilissimus" /LENGTH=279 /DNA_ID=CAMNT_0027362443 /DNA_START=196 /DNA_END=1035 /DNA_ORIENTATION=+
MGQPRDSPGARKQFLVICVIGVAVLAYSVSVSGLFDPLIIRDDGVFPGGEFIYKSETRDYAASAGLVRHVATDLNLEEDQKGNLIFSLYIDNMEQKVPFGKERFFGGILIDDTKSHLKETLLNSNNNNIHDQEQDLLQQKLEQNDPQSKANSNVQTEQNTDSQLYEGNYQLGSLPSVNAIHAKFVYTDGFISALIHNYKVFPALVKYAQDKQVQRPIVITTTCSAVKKMCTYYVPMVKGDQFLLGRPDTDTYISTLSTDSDFDFDLPAMFRGLRKLIGI